MLNIHVRDVKKISLQNCAQKTGLFCQVNDLLKALFLQ